MKVVSINVGLPREIRVRDKIVLTSIFKAPVPGPVRVRRLNLDGDQQSDLEVHGGADKALYAYPAEHYAFWRAELPDAPLPWGAFGENFTTEGLLEGTTYIGDKFRIGSAEAVVTQPRMPCYKLGIRFDRPDMVKRFLKSGRSGFYLKVSREGEVSAGHPVTLVSRDADSMTVAQVVALYTGDAANQDLLRHASELPALSEGWRDHFRKRLATLLLACLVALAASAAAQVPDSASSSGETCFRGRPRPRCQGFWITEFSVTPRVNANPSGGGGPNYYYTWDVGGMRNSGARTALGGAVFLSGEDDGVRFGVRFRHRRWVSSTTSFDLSPGILLAGGDNQRAPRFPGFTGSVGLMHRDLIGLAAQLELVPDSAGTVETAWYAGVKFGSYPGIVLSIVGPLLILIAIPRFE